MYRLIKYKRDFKKYYTKKRNEDHKEQIIAIKTTKKSTVSKNKNMKTDVKNKLQIQSVFRQTILKALLMKETRIMLFKKFKIRNIKNTIHPLYN